ncbi:TIGR03986 family CRISPR-associated RAMP protein [Desulfococcaceae bacterium HSG8]|nr:TIGR03986 family CRISPR-associated RAMP protein [Desulfococcaceae bacterium HSG8]
MEEGRLNIFESRNKSSVVEILFTSKKGKQTKVTVQGADISDEYNGKDVQFEREKGQVVKIICEEKLIFPDTDSSPEKMEIHHVENVQYPAHAPYNFIPLNEIVVEGENIPDFDKYHEKRYTGWIDLKIEAKTPLYIRGTLTEQDLKDGKESKDKPDFFSPCEELKIPGSSIRGMVRNLVEIVSFGKFLFYDDKRLYYRSFADVAISLRKDYIKHMICQIQGGYTIAPVAGYLKRLAGKFVIIPALVKDNTTYYKAEETLLIGKSFYPQTMAESFINRKNQTRYKPNKQYEFFSKEVLFKKTPPKAYKHTEVSLYYGKVTQIDVAANVTDPNNWEKGTLVCTGWIPSRRKGKHMHWLVNEEKRNVAPLELDDNLIKSYKDDVNRDEQADLIEKLKKHPHGVPCFYITDAQGEVISFGHTGMFRLAYEKTIGEHIPKNLKMKKYGITQEGLGKIQENKIFKKQKDSTAILEKLSKLKGDEFEKREFDGKLDAVTKVRELQNLILRHSYIYDIAEAIFGNESLFPGRVFFEDAFKKSQGDPRMGIKTPKILSSPKPTTFQHYLIQTKDDNKQLNHYNSDSSIRGHKFYWHRPSAGWEETDQNKIRKSEKQYTKINPVKSETEFSGRIRFENLSDVELGALLFCLELPEGCCHKLGMGKPLGLGSVKITPELYLSNRQKRYTDLFAEWLGDEAPRPKDIASFKESFEQCILGKIGEPDKARKSLWDTERLEELKLILDYETGKMLQSQGETRYMEIEQKGRNEFKFRPILPTPSGLISVKQKKIDTV